MIKRFIFLTENQVDRSLSLAPLVAVAPLLLFFQFRFLLPLGISFGLLTLYSLFTLGVCAAGFRNWKTESGTWIVACLMLASLLPVYFLIAYLRFFAEVPKDLPAPIFPVIGGQLLQRAADVAVSFGIIQFATRLALTVYVENVRRTGNRPLKWL